MPDSYLRFLVIRLSSVGDIVHALPAVAALGRAYPRAEIHWAVEERYAALLRGNPYVSRVLRIDTLGWRKRLGSGGSVGEILRTYAELREVPFDAAIDLQGLLKTGVLSWASRAKKRIGFSGKWLREPAAGIFYTHRVAPQGCRHIVELNLSLVESLGASAGPWEFPLPADGPEQAAVRERLNGLGVTDYIIVNPGGGWKAKRWSPQDYAEAIRRLAGDLPYDILLTGSQAEEAVIREILAAAGTPRAKWFPSTLLEFIALARGARLLIGGDTGPLHLAAAAGTPLVAIFNSSDPLNTPERNGPFNTADLVLCGPKQARRAVYDKESKYLEGVSVDSLVEAAIERLKRGNG